MRKGHKTHSLAALKGITQNQVGGLLWMMWGMSGAHQHTAVTAGQANESSENTNPLTKKSLCHISEGLPPSSPPASHVHMETSISAIMIK